MKNRKISFWNIIQSGSREIIKLFLGKYFILLPNYEGEHHQDMLNCSKSLLVYTKATLSKSALRSQNTLWRTELPQTFPNVKPTPEESRIRIMISNIPRQRAHPEVRQNNTNLLLSSIYKLTEDEDSIVRTENNMLSMIVQTLSINNRIDLIKLNSGLPFQRKSIRIFIFVIDPK